MHKYDMVLLILSTILLLVSVYFFSYSKFSYIGLTLFVSFFVLTVASGLFFFVSHTFTGEGINQAVLYHLKIGLVGAGFTAYTHLFFLTIATLIIMIALVSFAGIKSLHNKKQTNKFTYISVGIIVFAFIVNPAFQNVFSLLFSAKINKTVQTIVQKNKVLTAKAENIDPYSFAENYKTPTIRPKDDPKNLVFIYAEGFEESYSDETVFPGLTPRLNALKEKATVFTNITQPQGTGFTIAGIVGSQCGIPLVSASHGNSLDGTDRFLPGAVCLSDLLDQEGYYLSYMGGAKTTFAGKRTFFASHGYHSIEGLQELQHTLEDPTYVNGWGLFDDTLFEKAFKKFESLSALDKRFSLTMLTLDTHPPGGYPSVSCNGIIYEEDKNQLLNTFACSDVLLAEFIERILTSEYGENTVVVLVSDHFTMGPNKRLKHVENRSNRFMIFDGDSLSHKTIDTKGSTFDIGATLLPHLGFYGSIGLGRNLEDKKVSPAELAAIQNNAQFWTEDILPFWDYPTLSEQITIHLAHKQILFDDRTYKFPMLLGFDQALNVGTVFRFNLSKYALLAQISTIRPDMGFLLVEECSLITSYFEQANFAVEVPIPTESTYCLASGEQSINSIVPLTENKTLLKEEVRELTGL